MQEVQWCIAFGVFCDSLALVEVTICVRSPSEFHACRVAIILNFHGHLLLTNCWIGLCDELALC